MNCNFFGPRLAIHHLILVISVAACSEALAGPLPRPTKVRIVKNQPPTVSAGSDQTITLPASASLSGNVSDDGLPRNGSLTQTWSKASGPGAVTFANLNALATTANFSVPGTY